MQTPFFFAASQSRRKYIDWIYGEFTHLLQLEAVVCDDVAAMKLIIMEGNFMLQQLNLIFFSEEEILLVWALFFFCWLSRESRLKSSSLSIQHWKWAKQAFFSASSFIPLHFQANVSLCVEISYFFLSLSLEDVEDVVLCVSGGWGREAEAVFRSNSTGKMNEI